MTTVEISRSLDAIRAEVRARRNTPAALPAPRVAPRCPACQDRGFVRLEVPVTDPRFGRLEPCDCSAERIAAARRRALGVGSGLSEPERALRFEGRRVPPRMAEAHARTREIIARGWGWAYIHGRPGIGKTDLLKTSVAEMIAKGQEAVYVSWADMLEHIRGGYDAGQYDERVDAWRGARLLAIDEFGRARQTDWTEEILLRVVGDRYDSAIVDHATMTLFASQFEPESFGDWIVSRFRDGRNHIIAAAGADLRPLIKESK